MATFPFQKLDSVRVTEECLAAVANVLAALPRGEARLRSQLRDAMDSVYLNLCEGAGRFRPADKARFYDIAHGSATESAGALRIVRVRRLAPESLLEPAESLLDRVSRMVTALAISVRKRESR